MGRILHWYAFGSCSCEKKNMATYLIRAIMKRKRPIPSDVWQIISASARKEIASFFGSSPNTLAPVKEHMDHMSVWHFSLKDTLIRDGIQAQYFVFVIDTILSKHSERGDVHISCSVVCYFATSPEIVRQIQQDLSTSLEVQPQIPNRAILDVYPS